MKGNASLSFKGLTGHWSKWGGNVQDVLSNQEETFEHWFCQSCTREMGKELPPYFYEFPIGEYIRVCGICISENCIQVRRRTRVLDRSLVENPLDRFIK